MCHVVNQELCTRLNPPPWLSAAARAGARQRRGEMQRKGDDYEALPVSDLELAQVRSEGGGQAQWGRPEPLCC